MLKKNKAKMLAMDWNFIDTVKDMFDKFDEYHDLYLGEFESILDLKKYCDNNKLNKNSIYFSKIKNQKLIILSEIDKFILLVTILKISEYSRKKFKLITKWDKIIIMEIMDNESSYDFYKEMEIDTTINLKLDKIFQYFDEIKKRNKKRKISEEEINED